jgi:hypothetical protein
MSKQDGPSQTSALSAKIIRGTPGCFFYDDILPGVAMGQDLDILRQHPLSPCLARLHFGIEALEALEEAGIRWPAEVFQL